MRSNRHRPGVAVARILVLVSSVVLLGAVALSSDGARGAHDSQSFWSQVFFRAVGGEHYDSLAEMTSESELVVVGTVSAAEPSRSWIAAPELGDDGVAFYAKLRIDVEETIAGAAVTDQPGTVALEVFLTRWRAFPEFAASLPPERAIFFLRRKSDTDRPFYKLVAVGQGYIRDFGHAEAPAGASDAWLAELGDLEFGEVLDLVRDAATG